MRAMKDSGIRWAGQIPSNWSVNRNKVCFDCSKEIVGEKSGDTQLLSLTTKGIKEKRAEDSTGKVPESYDTYQVVTPNDIVMCLFDLDVSAVFSGKSPYAGMISPAYKVLRCREKAIIPSYAAYWFSFVFDGRKFKHYAKNLRYTLNYDEFAVLPIILPPIHEQEKIASFLDTECACIDAVMEQTRASIEEYKKLKQAVITQAVTKGIRPNRPMKDSGVDWIGAIPIDWECKRFKFFATVKSNLVSPDNYGDYPQISPENIEKGTGRLLPYQKVSEVGVISGNHLFYAGQILYSKIRPILNKVIIAPFDGLCSADMYPIETVLNIKFLLYALRSDSFLANIRLLTEDRVKMPKINQDELGNIFFAVPPEKDQNAIVYYLDKKNTEIDALIQKKEQLISEMEAYKKSIIFEYVTGKRGVQNE